MQFDVHVGVDYSGREFPTTRTPALQVYAAFNEEPPRRLSSPASTSKTRRNWCRKEVAEWLMEQADSGTRMIAGVDHGFSFPLAYFNRYRLKTWDQFLDDFCEHWPLDEDDKSVDTIRKDPRRGDLRTGSSRELRLTEQWTSSAKSVFQFDVQGSVAKSTHTGLPWVRKMRYEVRRPIHFWPFDGWALPDDGSVLAEIYPAIFKNRYPREERTADQQDAYCVARWLMETDQRGGLGQYAHPALTSAESTRAELEGWIFGIL